MPSSSCSGAAPPRSAPLRQSRSSPSACISGATLPTRSASPTRCGPSFCERWSWRDSPVGLRSGRPRGSGARRMASRAGNRPSYSKSCIRHHQRRQIPRSWPSSPSTGVAIASSRCCVCAHLDGQAFDGPVASVPLRDGRRRHAGAGAACSRLGSGEPLPMKPRVSVITLGVDDLDRALAFYRDGLGLPSHGIVGQEFEHGAVAFFELQGGSLLALWPRSSLARDTGLPVSPSSPTDLSLGHNVRRREEVDALLAQAERAGARVVKRPGATFWGGYSGYFQDPDGHLWEVAWNPQLLPPD